MPGRGSVLPSGHPSCFLSDPITAGWTDDRGSHRGHDVEIVLTTPIAHDRLREAAPVRRRTARVDQQYEVARRREHLLRRVERWSAKQTLQLLKVKQALPGRESTTETG